MYVESLKELASAISKVNQEVLSTLAYNLEQEKEKAEKNKKMNEFVQMLKAFLEGVSENTDDSTMAEIFRSFFSIKRVNT